jgi:hypothetical protein
MKWTDIAGVVGKVAPLLGAALGGPAGGAVGAMISAALGTENTPDAVAEAVKTNPEAAVKLAEVQANLEIARLQAETAQVSETQQTARAEQQSGDEYVRRTRPSLARKSAYVTFGYVITTGVLFPVVNALVQTALPGPDGFIISAVSAPCLAYIGVRSAEAFSRGGKT